MRKIYCFLIFGCFLLNIISCQSYQKEDPDPIRCDQLSTFNGLTTLNGENFSGSCYVFVLFEEQDKKTDLKSFKRGVPHGKYAKFHYPSEILDWEGYRKKGHIHGPYIKYHKNGTIAVSGKLKRGFYNGTWLYYDENGKLIDEKRYKLDGSEKIKQDYE